MQLCPSVAELADSSDDNTSSDDDDEEERETGSSDSKSDISIDDIITDLGGGLSLMEKYPVLLNDTPPASSNAGMLHLRPSIIRTLDCANASTLLDANVVSQLRSHAACSVIVRHRSDRVCSLSCCTSMGTAIHFNCFHTCTQAHNLSQVRSEEEEQSETQTMGSCFQERRSASSAKRSTQSELLALQHMAWTLSLSMQRLSSLSQLTAT